MMKGGRSQERAMNTKDRCQRNCWTDGEVALKIFGSECWNGDVGEERESHILFSIRRSPSMF